MEGQAITLTHELIESFATAKIGWTKSQLAMLGVAWPPARGWKAALVGTMIPLATLEELQAMPVAKQARRVRFAAAELLKAAEDVDRTLKALSEMPQVFFGDDEHAAWSALRAAIQKAGGQVTALP